VKNKNFLSHSGSLVSKKVNYTLYLIVLILGVKL